MMTRVRWMPHLLCKRWLQTLRTLLPSPSMLTSSTGVWDILGLTTVEPLSTVSWWMEWIGLQGRRSSYPYLLIEVCSDEEYQLDRYRMLPQAGHLVRVMNSFKDNTEEPFKSSIAVAVYVNRVFTAERYLVYQEDRNSPHVRVTKQRFLCIFTAPFFLQVRYSMDDFNLMAAIGTFKFLFELHNSYLPTLLRFPREQ